MSGRLLLVDDDETFRGVLSAALARRGYTVAAAADAAEAIALAGGQRFDYAVVDLRMPGPSGLTVVEALVRDQPDIRIVVLTGYASIATAVEAVKLGATHYLAKPVEVDAILQAFGRTAGDARVAASEQPLSVERLEWEYIQKVLLEHAGNVSATARTLGMHRRTLQRKLAKRPPRR